MTQTRDSLEASFEAVYREVTGSLRDVRPQDRLREDLAIDSLIAVEILTKLEDEHDIVLLDRPELQKIETLSDLVVLVEQLTSPTP